MHNTDEFTEEDYLHRKSGLQMPSRPPRANSLDKFTYQSPTTPNPPPPPQNHYISNIKQKYDLSPSPSPPNPEPQDPSPEPHGLQVVDLPKINWSPNIQAIIDKLQCVRRPNQDQSMGESVRDNGEEMVQNIPQDILILKQNTIDLLRTKNGDLH